MKKISNFRKTISIDQAEEEKLKETSLGKALKRADEEYKLRKEMM